MPELRALVATAFTLTLIGCTSSHSTGQLQAPHEAPAVEAQAPAATPRARGEAIVKWTEQSSSTVTLLGASDGVRVEKQHRTRKQEEVLAVRGDAVTKLRVTYEGDPESTFVVERRQGAVVVTGRATSAGLDPERVKDDYRSLGEPEAIVRHILSEPLTVGEHVDARALATAIRPYVTLADVGHDFEVRAAAATFAGMRDTPNSGGGAVAIFAMRLSLAHASSDNAARRIFQAELRGTISVRASDGRPVDLTLEGPCLAVEGSPRRIETGAVNLNDKVSKGVATLQMRRTYP